MQISPMAQVALLHTEINSGFRFVPRIGMNSAKGHTKIFQRKFKMIAYLHVCTKQHFRFYRVKQDFTKRGIF